MSEFINPIDFESMPALVSLKTGIIPVPDSSLSLQPMQPFPKICRMYDQLFTNQAVTNTLMPNVPFLPSNPNVRVSPKSFVTYFSGNSPDTFDWGSPDAVYWIIYLNNSGPIGHVSISAINFKEKSFWLGCIISPDS